MNNELLSLVTSKEYLIILADSEDTVVWFSKTSPVSALWKACQEGSIPMDRELTLYASQAGIAMGLFAERLPIRRCYADIVSEPGLQKLKDQQVSTEYSRIIPLIFSSQTPADICPVEKGLSLCSDSAAMWSFLEERFRNPAASSCRLPKSV